MNQPDPTGVDWAAAYGYLQEELESVLLTVADRLERLETELDSARRTSIRSVSLQQLDSGLLNAVIAADGADLTYAFYVYRDDALVREQAYTRSNTLEWRPDRSGAYRVRGFVRRGSDRDPVDTRVSETVRVSAS